jgi:hypothetical protein
MCVTRASAGLGGVLTCRHVKGLRDSGLPSLDTVEGGQGQAACCACCRHSDAQAFARKVIACTNFQVCYQPSKLASRLTQNSRDSWCVFVSVFAHSIAFSHEADVSDVRVAVASDHQTIHIFRLRDAPSTSWSWSFTAPYDLIASYLRVQVGSVEQRKQVVFAKDHNSIIGAHSPCFRQLCLSLSLSLSLARLTAMMMPLATNSSLAAILYSRRSVCVRSSRATVFAARDAFLREISLAESPPREVASIRIIDP